MKVQWVSYNSEHGTLHAVFFMGWVGHAFDYPSRALETFGEWQGGGTVGVHITDAKGCEASA